MRFFVLLIVCLMPVAGFAQCPGKDLRETLSEEATAEVAARIAGQPFAEGNYWIATRGDKTYHLIGTMHVDDPRFDRIAERLKPVITSADLLLVEASQEDQAALQRAMAENPDLAFLSGPTLIDLMAPEDWARLAEAARVRGMPPFMAAKFQPWYLSLVLSLSPCALKAAAEGKHGLDHRLMEIAEAADIPTRSLEHYTIIFDLFNRDPIEKQIEMMMLSILPASFAEDANRTLADQYFEESHIAALETMRVTMRAQFDLPPGQFDALLDDMMGLIVDQRNRNWIAPIEAAEGNSIVVATGALHLGGEVGLLNLLQQRGYTLERLPF